MIFLGGTCNNSTWRFDLMPSLQELNIKYFDPVVDDWNDEAQENERKVKADPNTIELYVITKEMQGVFSIAEVVDASNKRPNRTIFYFDHEGFDDNEPMQRSLEAVAVMVAKNGARTVDHFNSIPAVCAQVLNSTLHQQGRL